MTDHTTPRATRYLPQAVVATTAVVILPIAVVWWLRDADAISSAWLCVVLAIALSLAASIAGSAYWKRRRRSSALLFGELLAWGWVRRWRAERRLARGVEVLGVDRLGGGPDGHGISAQRRATLLEQVAVAIEAQDPYTDGHSRRVAVHSVMVARRMGLSSTEQETIRAAAAVHDLGKLQTPTELLNKPGKLTDAEFEITKRHAADGAEMVAALGDAELAAIVRHHHERFDGAGYPSGLVGDQVPLGARIVAVADTFDALTSRRPYRQAATHKQAIEVLEGESGHQLDPAPVQAFLDCYSGRRALVFWSVLVASPQAALAWVRARQPATPTASPSAMVAAAVASTAVFAAGFGATVSATPASDQLARAPQPPAQIVAAAVRHPSGARRASRHSSAGTSHPRTPAPIGPAAATAPSVVASPRSSPKSAGSGKPGRSGVKPPGPSGHPPGAGKPAGGGGKPGGGSGGGTSPGSGGTTGGSAGGTPPSGSGGGGGGSRGGSGGGSGGGGGGSGGPAVPPDKDACKNGGYGQYGYANQGLCVAAAEHASP